MSRVIRPEEWRAQRWANGGGVTHEIVRWMERDRGSAGDGGERAGGGIRGGGGDRRGSGGERGGGGGDGGPADGAFDVRVSLAEVERSGPFSRFEGYRRWTILVGEGPIELITDAGEHRLEAMGDRVELPGEVGIRAELRGGATRLLNVIARVDARIVVGHGPSAHAVRFVFALEPTAGLGRWDARVCEPAEHAASASTIWIADDEGAPH
ncbi:MAG TPA: HutD family protein [Kofleriaceae bacterium]